MASEIARRASAPLARTNTLEEVMRTFFSRRSPDTVRGYRMDLARLTAWLVAEGEDVGADSAGLARFLFAQGPGRDNALLMRWVDSQTRAGIAPATINRRLAAVRSLVKLGRTLGIINWALDVEGIRNSRNVRDMRGPTVANIQKLLHGARPKPFAHALLLLLFTRGLRSVEVRELQLKHLSLDEGVIFVRGKGRTGLEPLTLGDATIVALRTWLRARVGPATPDSYVFTVRRGKQLTHTTLWSTVREAAMLVGIRNVRPHGLRHAAITAVLNSTHGDIRTAQKFSRHTKPETLMRYDDERRDLGGEASKQLDKLVEE